MKHYIVNLSSFTNEKATELYKALSAYAYDVYTIANQPNVYEVFWENSNDTIQELCHIPSQFIKTIN